MKYEDIKIGEIYNVELENDKKKKHSGDLIIKILAKNPGYCPWPIEGIVLSASNDACNNGYNVGVSGVFSCKEIIKEI